MANKKIPITTPHIGITGLPFKVMKRDPETFDPVWVDEKKGTAETRIADTCDLLIHVWQNLPKWGVWPGANDSAHMDRISLAIADAQAKDSGEIVLTEGDYNFLHGKGESKDGAGDGRIGLFDRKEPKGKDFDDAADNAEERRDTVGSFVFGGNEARFRRALKVVPEGKRNGK